MNLYDKIRTIYPELNLLGEIQNSNIILRNDGDNRGDYIAKWEHPTLARPTQEQLDSVEEE